MENKPLILRHYGSKQYDPDLFETIKDWGFVKPSGGLWTSPVNSKYGWIDWCRQEDFGNYEKDLFFDICFIGKVLKIDSLQGRLVGFNKKMWKSPKPYKVAAKILNTPRLRKLAIICLQKYNKKSCSLRGIACYIAAIRLNKGKF